MALGGDRSIVIFVAISILLVLMSVILVYFITKFWNNRRRLWVKKRYPMMTIYMSIPAVLFVLDRIIYYLRVSGLVTTSTQDILWWIQTVTYSVLPHAVSWCALTRFYLIYYDFSWSMMVFESSWKVYLNHVTLNIQSDWFFKNKNRYGNINWLKPRIFCIFAIIVFASLVSWTISAIIWMQKGSDYNNTEIWTFSIFLDWLLYFIPMVCCLVLWCKTPRFYDSLSISTEMKYIALIFVMGVSLYVLFFLFGGNFMEPEIRDAVIIFIGALGYWSAGMVITCWVLYKMNKSDVHKIENNVLYKDELALEEYVKNKPFPLQEMHSVSFEFSSDPNESEQKTESEQKIEKRIGLEHILGHKEVSDLFVDHMMNEMSLEVILALIEFVQFKSCWNSNVDHSDCAIAKLSDVAQAIMDNEDISKSFIVHGELEDVVNYYSNHKIITMYHKNKGNKNKNKHKREGILSFAIRAYVLYNKYANSESELEINISFRERIKLKRLFDDLNADNVVINQFDTIFDAVILELVDLARYSLGRFKSSTQFRNLSLITINAI